MTSQIQPLPPPSSHILSPPLLTPYRIVCVSRQLPAHCFELLSDLSCRLNGVLSTCPLTVTVMGREEQEVCVWVHCCLPCVNEILPRWEVVLWAPLPLFLRELLCSLRWFYLFIVWCVRKLIPSTIYSSYFSPGWWVLFVFPMFSSILLACVVLQLLKSIHLVLKSINASDCFIWICPITGSHYSHAETHDEV